MANQAPNVVFATVPKITEGQPNALGFVSFTDGDAGGSTIQVTLAVNAGTLAAAATADVGVSGSGSGSLTLSGTLAAVNAFLSGGKATVTPVADSTASFNLTATIDDQDAVSPLSDAETVAITPAANGAPTGLKLVSPFNPSVTVLAVAENSAAGTLVGNLSATDPEGGAVTYAVTGDAANLFAIDGSRLTLSRALGDYETAAQKSYSVTVEARDAYGNTSSKAFTVQHADAYDAPEGTLAIDASGSAGGIDFAGFLASYFQGLANPSYTFYGGSTVPVYGNVNGEQIVYQYKENGVDQAERVVLEGTNLAYDAGNYGFAVGHGFSGRLDSITFGRFVDNVTTGTPGTGDAGLLKNLGTQVKISGLGLDVAIGTGHVAQVNLIYALHKAVEGGNAATIAAVLSNYAQNFTGSAGNDTFAGGAFNDRFAGKGGTDRFDGGAGADTLVLAGDRASYTVTKNADGSITLTDALTGRDGTVTASNVESFSFRDGEQTAAGLEQPLAAGRITIDASGSSGMSLESFLRGGFTADTTGGGFPAFDNGRGLSGAEMFIGYGTTAASKYVLMDGSVAYSMGTHTVAGSATAVEFGTRGSGAFGADGAFTGGNALLRITGLSLANGVPANAAEEAEIEANGPIHNFAVAHMYGAATASTQARFDKFADALDDYAQTFIGSAGADLFAGSRFNDVMRSGGGSDLFDGGAGADTVELAGSIAGWTLTGNANGTWTAQKGADTVGLANVEYLQFDDKRFDLKAAAETAANAGPASLALSAASIDENAAAGTAIGTLSAEDAEGDSFIWSLDAASAKSFEIVGGTLRAKAAFDHEAAATRAVTVIATDAFGASSAKTFTIAVADREEAPHSVTLSKASVKENSAVGTVVGTLGATDPEGKALAWSLTDSAGGLFKIEGDKLVLAKGADYEAVQSGTVTVEAKDAGGLTVSKSFAVEIEDVNEKPQAIALSNNEVRETAKPGTVIGRLSALDPEKKALVWSLAGSGGGLFKLDGDKLVLAKAVDFEKLQAETITVVAKDAGGLKVSESFAIEIQDVMETIRGDAKANKLVGGIGADHIRGGDGNDTIAAGLGEDVVVGGRGADDLYGGDGADTFRFESLMDSTRPAGGRDTIFDFDGKEGDRIDLSDVDANGRGKGEPGFTFIGGDAFSGAAGELRTVKLKSDTFLYADANGDRQADFAIHFDDALTITKGYLLL